MFIHSEVIVLTNKYTNKQTDAAENIQRSSLRYNVGYECAGFQRPTRRITGHFGDESFQTINCTGTDNPTTTTKIRNTYN